MSTKRLTFDLRRDDGEVTRLEGVAGLAVMMQTDVPVVDAGDLQAIRERLEDMPIISLRADNATQLAFLLAGLIASIGEVAGEETVEAAIILSAIVNAGDPVLRRVLPTTSSGG